MQIASWHASLPCSFHRECWYAFLSELRPFQVYLVDVTRNLSLELTTEERYISLNAKLLGHGYLQYGWAKCHRKYSLGYQIDSILEKVQLEEVITFVHGSCLCIAAEEIQERKIVVQ